MRNRCRTRWGSRRLPPLDRRGSRLCGWNIGWDLPVQRVDRFNEFLLPNANIGVRQADRFLVVETRP
jgi:hypothetical protein